MPLWSWTVSGCWTTVDRGASGDRLATRLVTRGVKSCAVPTPIPGSFMSQARSRWRTLAGPNRRLTHGIGC